MKEHLKRFWNALLELGHSYTNLFVEALKPYLPWIIPTPRWDNKDGLVIDDKPLAYTVGHLLAYAVAIGLVYLVAS